MTALTDRQRRTLQQLRDELDDLATRLESKRLRTAELAVTEILRDEPVAGPSVRVRAPAIVRPDGCWDILAASETQNERYGQELAQRHVHDTHANGAKIHWIVADLAIPVVQDPTTAIGTVQSVDG